MEESLRMAKDAAADGVHTIIATPHHANGTFENGAEKIREAVSDLNRELERWNIPLTVLPGQEVRVHRSLIDECENGNILPLNEGRYLLLELPPSYVPPYFADLVHELRVMGKTPIIAHPERNAAVAGEPELLAQWIELGALCQITSGSLTGLFGKRIQQMALRLCKRQYVHFIASDGHRPEFRPIRLADAYETVRKKFGEERSDYYRMNAHMLIEGREIEARAPEAEARRFFLSMPFKRRSDMD